MLSICIPIYNFDVRTLVGDLAQQMSILEQPCELILIDDKSTDAYREINREECSKHLYIELDENIGRSRIRNLFLKYARYDYLLFLDCDVGVRTDFLAIYCDYFLHHTCDVIFGGLQSDSHKPLASQKLRWKYGNKRESVGSDVREKSPYKFFKTCNFIIKKSVLDEIRFNEKIVGYGHEDTLFAIELEKHKKSIAHIDNAVSHNSNETNQEFLEKTKKSAENLVFIFAHNSNKEDIVLFSKLLYTHFELRKNRILWMFKVFYFCFGIIIEKLLKSGLGNLFLFDIYKLNCLHKAMKKIEKKK